MMKTTLGNKDPTLRLVNELIKLNGFNDLISWEEVTKLCIDAITQLEITYVSVKCKPLQRR